MTLIKDPLSPENAEKLEEAAKDISKAALVHHTATQQDELKIIIEERDLLYKENYFQKIYQLLLHFLYVTLFSPFH